MAEDVKILSIGLAKMEEKRKERTSKDQKQVKTSGNDEENKTFDKAT